MKRQRPLLHVVLSLMLLFSQQIGWAHVISHLGGLAQSNPLSLEVRVGEASFEQTRAQSLACEQCLSFAQFSSALPLDLPTQPSASAPKLAPLDLSSLGVCIAVAHPYLARAPPLFS